MTIVFVNERNFFKQMKFFVNDSVLQNKNDWWTRRPGPSEKWKKLLLFKNEEKITNDINRSNKQIFQKILTCTIVFYWTNDFLEQTLKKNIFYLNERFYWTVVHWENQRNKWKMNDLIGNERNNFFQRLKKKLSNYGSFTNDKRTKWKSPNARISS